jgi:hypothetical protein
VAAEQGQRRSLGALLNRLVAGCREATARANAGRSQFAQRLQSYDCSEVSIPENKRLKGMRVLSASDGSAARSQVMQVGYRRLNLTNCGKERFPNSPR